MERKIKAKIPTKNGFVEVEGSPEDVRAIVESLGGTRKERHITNNDKRENSIKYLIVKLIDAGFFDEPKNLGEIQKELQRKGFALKTTVISPIIHRDFLVDEILEREGERGKYRYFLSKRIMEASQ